MKTLEEIAEEFLIRQGCQRMCCNDPECNGVGDFFEDVQPKDLIEFAKWQAERMYSKEEVISAMKNSYGIKYFSERKFLENLKQFKKK